MFSSRRKALTIATSHNSCRVNLHVLLRINQFVGRDNYLHVYRHLSFSAAFEAWRSVSYSR